MGVHGLWELLAPVGRRVSVETLAGKRLAIDASIWIIQFMKAMRDEKGEMVRNSHILGFFRRICKLLYLRTKPVFVFDGGTPALKRRTVIARRRQRENAQTKIRKTAEKLLLNHLKQMRLQELAADLEKQRRDNDVKGKKPTIEEVPNNESKDIGKGKFVETGKYNHEELDQMLAASLAAEENEGFITNDGSTSGAGVNDDDAFGDEEEDDEDEEMIIPEMHGKVDPAVLAALPPSMQLDLLVQMRERLMAENRQKYQKVKKAPSRFSELQIESYLKTVAFRREIDGVQKAASGRGIGGVQTSRIASEANREFIFSSSFTGDKQALASVAQESSEANQSRASPAAGCSTNVVNEVLRFGGAETGKKVFHEDVETYRDERGRLRLNKARALGISMTRDLQRNLDLMKEIDQQNGDTNHRKNSSESISAIEISFEDTLENENGNYDDDDDDKLFARLVAGDRINNLDSVKESLNSVSDNEWEEGLIENKSVHEVESSDGGEVEWEEGFQDTELKSSSCPDEIITKGVLEEEANIQEAIRISLEETRGCNSTNDFHGDRKMISEEEDDEVFVYEGKEDGSEIEASAIDVSKKEPVMKGAFEEEANIQEAIRISLEETTGCSLMNDFHGDIKMVSEDEDDEVFVYEGKEERSEIEASATDISKKLPSKGVFEEGANIQETVRSIEDTSKGHTISEGDRELVSEEEDRVFVYEGEEEGPEIEADVSQPNSTEALESNAKEMKSAEFDELIPEQNNSKLLNQDANASNIFLAGETIEVTFSGEVANSNSSSALMSSFNDAQQIPQAELDYHSYGTAELGKISGVDSITDADGTKELAKEKKYADLSMENEEVDRNSSLVNDDKDREMTEDRLEEEMLFLGKEREELGSEQRKLERNSESVSGEMFAECQELLQMFGLPYIIAPMEAEAQCAFLELSNLVDGVVTDDSDAFLFGSRSVYKNIFDDRKYVETYFMKDIENELGLDREKIIHMALLLGSDYTEGISGIGIVNAIEVVNAFPGKDGLREFREWIESPDPNILGKLHVESGNSKKKGSKGSEDVMNVGSNGDAEGVSRDLLDDAERVKKIFMDKHRNVSKNWHISSSFPSDAVISAYAVPQVDKSTEPLSWGKPDLFVLRKLCWEKFGWGTSKADELLQPVLKEYNKHETQLRLEAFYSFNERFAKIRSKRINKAVKEITKHKSSDLMDETTTPTSGRKRKAKPCGDETDQSGVVSQGLDGAGPANDAIGKPTVKKLRRGQKGSGGRGRGRGQTSGRGRRKKNPSWEEIEIDTSESDEETQIDESEESCRVRRSGRLRKTVNYNVADELDSSDKESDGNRLKESSTAEESFVDKEVSRVNERDRNESKERSPNFVEDNEETYEKNNPTSNLVEDDDDDDKIDEHFKESQSSKDYIQFGGGFCVDEDEEMETNHEKYDGLSFGDLLVEENPEGNNSSVIINEVNTNDETRIDNESDFGGRYSKSLRPMPNLRRKKKRN